MGTEPGQNPDSAGKRIFRTSKKVLSKTSEVTGKMLEKAIDASAAGIDKSTGASRYQTDALAVNGRLERALQVIETALAQKTEENRQLSAQLHTTQSEATRLRAQLAQLQSRVASVVVEPAATTATTSKKRWWKWLRVKK